MKIIAMKLAATTTPVYEPSEPAKTVKNTVDVPASKTPQDDHPERQQLQEERLSKQKSPRNG